MSENNQIYIPKWINIYLWITIIISLVFSVLAYAQPEIQFGTWQAFNNEGSLSLAGPLGNYIARNFAIVAVGAFALSMKSLDAIRLFLVLRIVTDAFDAAHNFIGGNSQMAWIALVMLIIEVAAMVKINFK